MHLQNTRQLSIVAGMNYYKQFKNMSLTSGQNSLLASAFPLTFRLIGECPNFLETIVPNALKGCLYALNFVPICYQSMPNVIFPQICRIF